MTAPGGGGRGYLMPSARIAATEAAGRGLIKHVVPADELDARVEQRASSMLDASLGNEPLTNYTDNHRKAVAAFSNKRKPVFGASCWTCETTGCTLLSRCRRTSTGKPLSKSFGSTRGSIPSSLRWSCRQSTVR